MNVWADAYDEMNRLDNHSDDMTNNQRLELAKVKALLAIGQELSAIRQRGEDVP